MARYAVMSEEDRVLIKQLRLQERPNGKSWCAKPFLQEFPNKNWKLETLKKIIWKIDATGYCKRLEGSGRPHSARTQRNKEAAAEFLSQEDQGFHTSPHEKFRLYPCSLMLCKNEIRFVITLMIN